MLRSHRLRAVLVLSLLAAAVSLPAVGTAARPAPPSLRLLAVLHRITAVRFGTDKHLYLSPGAYVAAVDGAFEIDAKRTSSGITLWQVERDAHGVTPIRQITTPAAVHFASGLPRLLHLVVRDSAGKAVLTKDLAECLNGAFNPARVDASGPDQPTYPYDCGGPMSHGAVWGIDQGWANELFLDFNFAPPDGTYTLDLSIAPSYASQLQIPDASAHVSLQLVVQTLKDGDCGIKPTPCPPAFGAAAASTNAAAATTAQATAGEGPRTATAGGTDPLQHVSGIPDMRALPAHDLSITHTKNGHDYLNFGATIWDAGSGPLVVEGFRSGDSETMNATQFIYQDGRPVSSQSVGQFEFDHRRGHDHWHMENIAQYDLLDLDGNQLVRSDKQSFCLAPTDAIDLTLPGAAWQPDRAGLWSACQGEDAIWLREVLPAGWGDTYYQSVAGQSFDITKLANGHYQIRVTADPNNSLVETDYTNNTGLRTITLGGTPGHRTVKLG